MSPSLEAGPDEGPAISKSWKMQTVELPSENACLPVVITAIYSPVRFWVHLFPSNTNSGMNIVCVCVLQCMGACEQMEMMLGMLVE